MKKKVKDYFPEVYGYYWLDDNGNLYTDNGETLLSNNSLQNGYIVNSLYGEHSFRKEYKRHFLVASIFLSNKESNKKQINHINGIKTDNRVENLEWCTPKENITHAWKNNLSHARTGSNNNFSKLEEKEVLEIAALLEENNMMQKDIAKKYNVHKATISAIKTRKNWKHLTENFRF